MIRWAIRKLGVEEWFVLAVMSMCTGAKIVIRTEQFIGRPFVKRFALCYQTILTCPVCDVVVLSPNGWMDQDEIRHAGRPQPWSHCV